MLSTRSLNDYPGADAPKSVIINPDGGQLVLCLNCLRRFSSFLESGIIQEGWSDGGHSFRECSICGMWDKDEWHEFISYPGAKRKEAKTKREDN